MTDCVLIVNPVAGNGRAARLWPQVARLLAAGGWKPEVRFTDLPGAATRLARDLLRSGRHTLIALGGDGTINEVVNGFFEDGQPINPSARLGIVCCGTGADFIRTISAPRGQRAVAGILQGHSVRVDVGWAEFRDRQGRTSKRHFLNFADLGLGGETVRRVESTSKAFGGFASFLWGAIQAILSYRGQAVEIRLDDDEPFRQTIGDVVVANGRYFGGGMFVAPTASIVDGLLDVFVLGDVPKMQLLFDLLPKVYRGAHLNHPSVSSHTVKRIAIHSTEKVLLDIDGELVGSTDVAIQILPQALSLLVPSTFISDVRHGTVLAPLASRGDDDGRAKTATRGARSQERR